MGRAAGGSVPGDRSSATMSVPRAIGTRTYTASHPHAAKRAVAAPSVKWNRSRCSSVATSLSVDTASTPKEIGFTSTQARARAAGNRRKNAAR